MENTVAYMGSSRPLDILELKSHLTIVNKMEHIGVFLGAGASKESGGKLVSEIWDDFCRDHTDTLEWLKSKKFISNELKNVNLEQVFDKLQIAEEEWKRQELTDEAKALREHRDNLYRSVIEGALLSRECLESPDKVQDIEIINNHRKLLRKLVSGRQPSQPSPWIFTPNYDLAIEWAAESIGLQVINGFSGFHYRTFDPRSFELGFRNIQARGEARFGVHNVNLVKLHGSLTWIDYENGHHFVREVASDIAWQKLKAFLNNKGLEEDGGWPGFLIYPSAAKFFQTTGFIYGELFRRFSEFLSRPNVCLIVNGYSFGDDHINRLLLSAVQNPTLQLVLYSSRFTFGVDKEPKLPDNSFIKTLWQADIPRVTFIGKNKDQDRDGYFMDLINDLPEPALTDEHAQSMKRLMRELNKSTLPETPRIQPTPTRQED